MTNLVYSFQHPSKLSYTGPNYNYLPMNKSLNDMGHVMVINRKLENINCILQPNQQAGGLYLGDIISIVKTQHLINNKIEAILSCLAENNYPVNLPSGMVRKIIEASDSLNYPINVHFDQAFNFIQNMRNSNKNILIHCHAGVSRSAAIVCAYLMRKNGWGFDQTIGFLKERRSRVKPNDNFVRILRQYQKIILKPINSLINDQNINTTNFTDRENQKNLYYSRKFTHQLPSSREQNKMLVFDTSNDRRYFNSLDKYQQKTTYKHSSLQKNYVLVKQQRKQQRRQQKIQQKKEQKNDLTFGEVFKNKVSKILGRKTRIAWDLSKKNTQRQNTSYKYFQVDDVGSWDRVQESRGFCF